MEYKPGSVVEYKYENQYDLGLVVEAGKSLLVLTRAGQRARVSLKRVSFGPLTELSTGLSDDLASGQLDRLDGELRELVQGGELEELWELLREEEAELGLDAMADLLYGEQTAMTRLAATRLLRADPAYFKQSRESFLPRPPDQVQALLEQARKEAERGNQEEHFVERVVEIWGSSKEARERRPQLLAAMADDADLRERIMLLARYAAVGEDFGDKERARKILARLEAEPGLHAEGRGAVKAFDMVVRLGYFSPWEELGYLRHGIETTFSERLLRHAASLAAGLPWRHATSLSDLEAPDPHREDLTHIPTVTIDAASTRDLDDGVSLLPLEGGRWRLLIHIADPAAVVEDGDPLDDEALRRGATVYTPGYAVPMFPRLLSEEVLSLLEGVVRPSMSFEVILTSELAIESSRPLLAWVRVDHRMSYDEVDAILEDGLEHPLSSMILELDRVAEALMRRRLGRGAVVMNFPEASLHIEGERDEEGRLWTLEEASASSFPRERARRVVGETMILVGEMMGLYAREHEIPVIYRSQPPPTEAEDQLAGRVLSVTESFELRRYMQKGERRTTPAAHFGLGLEVYSQATSPIRRYGDLVHHRQLHAHLQRGRPHYDEAAVLTIAARVDALISDSLSLQREAVRFWKLVILSQRVGQTLGATVAQFVRDRSDRAVVILDEVALTVPLALTESVEPGDRIEVSVEQVKPRRDVLVLKMVSAAATPPPQEPA